MSDYPKWMDCPTNQEMTPEIKELYRKAKEKWKEMDDQREEIIRAFIAKYHCDPAECVQVITCSEDGERKFAVRKQTPEETEMFRKAEVEP